MAVSVPSPMNPVIAAAVPNYAAGATGAGFLANLNSRQDTLDGKITLNAAFVEKLTALWGNGWVSGGAVTIGTGLSVNVAAYEAIVGNHVQDTASQVVGGLAANATGAATNYLWLRQDGTWTVNQTGTKPGTGDSHGDALLWGTADTDTSNVIAVSNARAGLQRQGGITVQRNAIQSGEAVRIGNGEQATIWSALTISGTGTLTLTGTGEMRIRS